MHAAMTKTWWRTFF